MDPNNHPINKIRKSVVSSYKQEEFMEKLNKKREELEKQIQPPIQNPGKNFISLLKEMEKEEETTRLKKIGIQLCKILNPEFEYVRTLGKGGEAIVILIRENTINDLQVIKVARPQAQGQQKRAVWVFSLARTRKDYVDTDIKKRFLRGASIQRTLSSILEYGKVPTVYKIHKNPLYMEMEFSKAKNFLNFIAEKEQIENLYFFINLLAFVNEIHSYNIIHRDLKPDNILIRDDGLPVLLDFTTSKQIGKEDDNLTGVGYQICSPLWGSPKLMIDAASADYRDDIFSLGMILYVIVTKKIPAPIRKYNKKKGVLEYVENLNTIKGRTMFINRIQEEIPKEVKDIFLKATIIEERNRYQLLEEMINDVKSILENYEETKVKKHKEEYLKTHLDTNKNILDMLKRIEKLEEKFNKISQIYKD